ncbi:SDR family NAD(P)-dependent oxidoreductase [Nocardia sp. NPDC049149]|uniref:SDR family NAD(P)-dependent oxidoreductase n=1 Tax=Nocardia sp. NPDC049149 TaxID=3364315 RepID=UPI0037224296
MTLEGKVALVTGSSRGLGRAIALRFAQQGADLVINYARDAAAADDVQAQASGFGVKAVAVQADVSTPEGVEHLFRTALDTFGRLDVVVANAGIEKVNIPVTDITDEDFDLLLRVNTKGPFLVLRAAARHIADGGRIINVASSTTQFPAVGLGLYGTSKVAPTYLVQVLAKELGPRGVTVNSLIPGAIDDAGIFDGAPDNDPYKTDLRESVPLGRLATTTDVADVAELLADPKAAFVTGQNILMNGGSNQ